MPDRNVHDRIAHDLKAALSPIQTAAYVLRRPGQLPEAKTAELAAVIERQTRRLARMIDEATEWQRAVEGRIQLRAGELLPGELLDAAAATLEAAPQLRWTTPNDRPFVGDSYRLQQMLVALLAFACRRDPAGAPVVEASAGADRLAWTITDGGPACAVASLLLQPDEMPADEGLGLGLLTAHAIARQHGGDLQASAVPGGGVRLECVVRPLAQPGP